MKGGGEKTIPIFDDDPNDPKIPNEQKEILHPKPAYSTAGPRPPTAQGPQPFITLQVATPPKPKPAIQPPLQYLPSMTMYPTYPQVPSQVGQLGYYAPPTNIVNQLVIGDQNPYQDHNHIHMIYEDVLPLKHLPNSLNTLSERLTLYNFIKSIVLLGKDGENIPFRKGTNNLFDKLKATDLNPYHSSDDVMKYNPYSTLPTNFLIYRSCYPIKRDASSVDAIVCAKDAIGMNIRLYRLSQGEVMVNRTSGSVYESEVWRDIMYYEYVRENIIRRKQSPNFVMLIGYAMCNDSEIDFEKIEQLKHHEIKETAPKLQTNKKTNLLEANPKAYGNDILTAITESATYSLIQWATKIYANVGRSKRMINMGYHPDEVWFSIVFQIMAAMYTMQKHGIYINDFNLRDNIYIKDLTGTSNITTYWKYVIDDVSYYIPNYGFLVMIDSKFKDVPASGLSVGTATVSNHKIIGSIFNDPSTPPPSVILDKILDAFIGVINMNNFGSEFVHNGGVTPIDKTRQVIDKINTFAVAERGNVSAKKEDIIGTCIRKFMCRFMNNRIGTILTKQEQDDTNKIGKDFNKGDIVVYEESAGLFKFVLFYQSSVNSAGFSYIITKNGGVDDSAILKVPIGSLYEYSKIQPLRQNYKPNEAKLDESDLLETYNINS